MWLIYATLTIIFYAIFDFFLKNTGGKIDDFLGAFLINLVSMLIPLIWLIYLKLQGEHISFSQDGIKFSILAGISIGIASITFIKFFATGTSLSLGIPLIRTGIIILAVILGALLLKESLSAKQIIGIITSIIGLYLIVAK
jgi:uncharacterized membrane protein